MKNPQPEHVTLPINAAHLMSITGMLQQFAPEDMHAVFSLQVAEQAAIQGLNVYDLEDTNYKKLLGTTIAFSIPTGCIADVGTVIMEAHKSTDKDTLKSALSFLNKVWQPFAVEAINNIKKMGGRFDDISRESLN
tara:strand:- start:57 stop:461 length:405 start_codon:yes stop_codon:yes gene_type:complete